MRIQVFVLYPMGNLGYGNVRIRYVGGRVFGECIGGLPKLSVLDAGPEIAADLSCFQAVLGAL